MRIPKRSDIIYKSLEENDETSILHLRKVERHDSRVDDPETGFYYDDEDYDVEVQVANREIYNYSSSLNSVTKYLEENLPNYFIIIISFYCIGNALKNSN